MCIRRQRGITLIEQIMFMIVVSVGVIGIVSVMGTMMRASADPMITKQSVAIAESLLNEVLHQPFTWCDPDDAAAATATAYGACATPQNALGPTPAGEGRNGGAAASFDNVLDYAGFAMDDIADPTGTSFVAGYRAEVAIAPAGATFGLADAAAALAITVTICRTTVPSSACAGRDSFALTGYRFRYAPRT